MEEQHYFTGHTNARLTFIIGMVTGICIVTVMGFGFFAYLFSGGELATYGVAPLDSDSQILTEPMKTITADTDTGIVVPGDAQVYGAKENYAVTLVQYIDYECRFCKKFFPDLLEFVDQHNGEVRFIVKHYPVVQIHPQAKTAAIAATCAGEQGKFFEYSTALFNHQNELAVDSLYDTLAGETGLDAAAFSSCRADATVASLIESNAQEAVSLDVVSQPNLIVWHNNGDLQLIDGYVNISYVASVLGDELTPVTE